MGGWNRQPGQPHLAAEFPEVTEYNCFFSEHSAGSVRDKTLNGDENFPPGVYRPLRAESFAWGSAESALLGASSWWESMTLDAAWEFADVAVPPGGSVDIPVEFNATELIGGLYGGGLRVTTNDPAGALVGTTAGKVYLIDEVHMFSKSSFNASSMCMPSTPFNTGAMERATLSN